MDLIAALFAVAAAALAYSNLFIVKRLRTGTVTAVSRHTLVKSLVASIAYIVATCLFALSAIESSTTFLIRGTLAVAIAGVASLVFSALRPRR